MKKTVASLVGLLVLASPLVLTLPWNDWVEYGAILREFATEAGEGAPWLFVLLTILGTALGIPRLLFCVMGGWLFGFEEGFIWSQIGSLLGAYLLFLLARSIRPERLMRRFPSLRRLSIPTARGWLQVLLIRQLPLAGLYNDILLAWSPVTHRDFWVGSFMGFLPLGVTASLIGAGILQADLAEVARYLAAATLAFVLLSGALRYLLNRAKPRLDPEAI